MGKSREQKRLERKQAKAKIRAQQYAASAERKRLKGHVDKKNRPVKVGGYSHQKADARLNKKRREAQLRKQLSNQLTKMERIHLINNRPGNSKKELDRVLKMK